MIRVGDEIKVVNPQLRENLGVEGIVTGLFNTHVRIKVTKPAGSFRRVGEMARFDIHRVRRINGSGFGTWFKEHGHG